MESQNSTPINQTSNHVFQCPHFGQIEYFINNNTRIIDDQYAKINDLLQSRASHVEKYDSLSAISEKIYNELSNLSEKISTQNLNHNEMKLKLESIEKDVNGIGKKINDFDFRLSEIEVFKQKIMSYFFIVSVIVAATFAFISENFDIFNINP